MRHLGILRGSGTIESGNKAMGRATFELDGYVVRPGEIVASGEIRMAADELNAVFGKNGLSLRTDDGRLLSIRFSGKRLAPSGGTAHADVRGDLPPEKEWRRARR